jgi:hypothetical protein
LVTYEPEATTDHCWVVAPVHFWSVPPLQVYWLTATPCHRDWFGTSAHLALCRHWAMADNRCGWGAHPVCLRVD